VRATDEWAELIARRVAELVKEDRATPLPQLLTPEALAGEIGWTREAVYAHAEELGAIRLGEGERPRLWFDRSEVRKRLTPPPTSRTPDAGQGQIATGAIGLPRTRDTGNVELLPIRGEMNQTPRTKGTTA
jgi:hypothetical protein